MKIKCADIVKMVTDEATEQFRNEFIEDLDMAENLFGCCSIIDSLVERFDGIECEANVDRGTHDITISLITPDIQIIEKDDEFYELLMWSKGFTCKAPNPDSIQMDFVFSGIWRKTEE